MFSIETSNVLIYNFGVLDLKLFRPKMGPPTYQNAEDEADEWGAALDGSVHGDVHAVDGVQAEGGVQGEEDGGGQELAAVVKRVRTDVEVAQKPASVSHALFG
jgi:hypothetical protein